MILNVSTRTDIVAFYTPWFLKRLKEGFVDVRNPFYPTQVSRILLQPETVEAIVFCTKNPLPILPHLEELEPYPYCFQITLTPYGREIEPFVPPKGTLIKTIQTLSEMIGKDRILVRYDPILLSDRYTIEYHRAHFETLCKAFSKRIDRFIISFLDLKKNTKVHQANGMRPPTEEEVFQLAELLGSLAQTYHIPIQTCAEPYDLTVYGFEKESCISESFLNRLLASKQHWPKSNNREHCHCVKTVDLGVYNSCPHYCQYCYANYKEEAVKNQVKQHNPNSSFLIGEEMKEDQRKIRTK